MFMHTNLHSSIKLTQSGLDSRCNPFTTYYIIRAKRRVVILESFLSRFHMQRIGADETFSLRAHGLFSRWSH